MPRLRFEPATPATKRPQTYALDWAATGIGVLQHYSILISVRSFYTLQQKHVLSTTLKLTVILDG
jgi:hypothetical protein